MSLYKASFRFCISLLIIFFLLSFSAQLYAQSIPKKFTQKPEIPESQKTSFEAGEFHLENKDYAQALNYFQSLYDENNDRIVYKYRLAICYLYNSEEIELALQYLKEILKVDKSQQHFYYYLGFAFARNYKFDEAIVAYNRYLLEGQEKEVGYEIKRLIEQCEFAKKSLNDPKPVVINNIGSPINSDFNEYVPVISSDESVLMFTYQGPKSKGGLMDEKFNEDPFFGEYYEDIFVSYKVGSSWLDPIPLPDNINSLGHDACIALSGDGQKLFIFKSNLQDNGDIYMSTLDGETWGDPVKMGPEINSTKWDGSISLSADENTVYFSSERPGGYGGKDIWYSLKQADGSWGKATNLGPVINTKYDDDAPFIHADGKTFYFSSQGHNCMGGYDIFKSSLNDDMTLSEPQNIGHPINTPGDDIYFVVSANGDRGYYASGKVGGLGKRDIYVMDLNPLGPKPIVALVRGTVTDNGKPVKATIYYENESTGKKIGPFYTNASTGKYILTLKPGANYKISYDVSGYTAKTESVDLRSLTKFVEVYKNVYFPDNITNSSDSTPLALQTIIENKVKETEAQESASQNKVVDVSQAESIAANNQQNTQQSENQTKEQNQSENIAVNQQNIKQTEEVNKTVETDLNRSQAIDDNGLSYLFSGKIVDRENPSQALGNVKVNLLNEEKDLIQSGYTGPDGTFTFNNLDLKKSYSFILEEQDSVLKNIKAVIVKDKKGKILLTIARNKEGKFIFDFIESDKIKLAFIQENNAVKNEETTAANENENKSVNTKTTSTQIEECNCSKFVNKDLNDISVYKPFISECGNVQIDGLIFKVQIGAYRFPSNFKYDNVKDLASAEVVPYGDGITRFTMKEFINLKEAEKFRQLIINSGITDAWIVAFYKGKRMVLDDLIKQNFFRSAASM